MNERLGELASADPQNRHALAISAAISSFRPDVRFFSRARSVMSAAAKMECVVELGVDHAKRRMTIKARPGFAGSRVSNAIASAIKADPSVASYDFVMDVRDSDTGATVEDFNIVHNAYKVTAREPGMKYGCFVSLDPNYGLWASAMGQLFGDRECPVFSSPEEAHDFLDRQRKLMAA